MIDSRKYATDLPQAPPSAAKRLRSITDFVYIIDRHGSVSLRKQAASKPMGMATAPHSLSSFRGKRRSCR